MIVKEIIEISCEKELVYLYKFICNKKLIGKHIIIDLSKLETFITSPGVLLMVMFIIFHKNLGCQLFLLEPENFEVKSFLESVRIKDFCQRNYSQSHELEPIDTVTAFPIWRLDEEKLHHYIIASTKYFNSISPNKDFIMLGSVISEIANNVYNHSQSTVGAYIFTRYIPETRFLETTIADLGVGIPYSINTFLKKYGKSTLTDTECLSRAMELNFTTQSIPQNRGKGLDIVKSFIATNKGKLQIYSGTAFYNLKENGMSELLDNPLNYFKGTIVNLLININNLEKLENEEGFVDIW